jgi:hypothetical protein
MKQRKKHGRKHLLLFYKHSMDRIWRSLLLLDIIMWISWWFAPFIPAFQPPKDWPLEFGGIAILALLLIVFYMRNNSFVQARDDYLLIKVPLYRLKIHYSFCETVRTAEMRTALQGAKLSGGDKRFLQPYRGDTTVLMLILRVYPKSMGTLRIFFPRYMFLTDQQGFLLLIKHWIDFSTEFDSRVGIARGENYVPVPQEPPKKEMKEDSPGLYNLFGE